MVMSCKHTISALQGDVIDVGIVILASTRLALTVGCWERYSFRALPNRWPSNPHLRVGFRFDFERPVCLRLP